MDDVGLGPTGTFGQTPGPAQAPARLYRALLLVPAGGLMGTMGAISAYRPVDQGPFLRVTVGLFLAIFLLIGYVQRKARRREDVSSFFPMTYWLACVPAVLGLAFWLNGALDHSVPEPHQQVVTRKFVSHGGHGTSYYIEFTSWRPERTTEKLNVRYRLYTQLQIDDSIVVDLRRGALAIPWIGAVHKPQ
jgi:hypothetical protein